MTRTAPEDAIISLAEWLNLHAGQKVPLNELVRESGLAWATVRKYVALMDRLQHVLPGLTLAKDGVTVTHRGMALEEGLEDPLARKVLAIWLFQRIGATEDIPETSLQIPESLDELEALGFVERTGETARLSPAGLSFANSIYGDYLAFGNQATQAPEPAEVPWLDEPFDPPVVHEGEKWRPARTTNVMAA